MSKLLAKVDETNQLSHSGEMVIDYPYVIEHKIRVIGYAYRKRYIDTIIEEKGHIGRCGC